MKVLPLLITGLLLSACAPTQQAAPTLTQKSAPMSSSVFQVGQQWRVTWGDGQVGEYTVGAYQGFHFDHEAFEDRQSNELVTFDYTPRQTPILGIDFTILERVELSVYYGNDTPERHCVAFASGPVAPGYVFEGFFYRKNHADGIAYTRGKPVTGPTCRLIRLT